MGDDGGFQTYPFHVYGQGDPGHRQESSRLYVGRLLTGGSQDRDREAACMRFGLPPQPLPQLDLALAYLWLGLASSYLQLVGWPWRLTCISHPHLSPLPGAILIHLANKYGKLTQNELAKVKIPVRSEMLGHVCLQNPKRGHGVS